MRKLSSIFLGVALMASLAALVPAPAKADFPWCAICEGSWDCYACCRCEGLSSKQCGIECGGSGAALACADDSLATEVASADETETTADNETPEPEELTAVAADNETPVPEEPRPVATR